MKRYMKFLMLTGLSAMLLASAACYDIGETPSAVVEIKTPAAAVSEEETVHVDATPMQEDALPAVPETEVPTPEPTPEPPRTPAPTREPMEGDVSTDRFPSEDTGRDADWSYQSDELRVAIKRVEDEDDQIVYYVADIWVRNINSFRTELANGKYNSGREDPEEFANRINAVFGISGTMNSGLVVHNGTKYRGVDSSNISFRSGIAIVYRDGSVKMINRAKHQSFNYNNENKQNGGILHALQFGPILVQNGEIPTGLKQRERHPRIIFGYCEPGHYICVAVDGRTKKSVGMTEQEMAELMLSLGCTDAMNLDGGNSAVMLFMGKTINVPSGTDRDGDGVAGRNIVDMLAFAEFDADGNAPSLSTVKADKIWESEP